MPQVTIHYPEAGTSRRVRVPNASHSVVVMAMANGAPFVITATENLDHATTRMTRLTEQGFPVRLFHVVHNADGWHVWTRGQ